MWACNFVRSMEREECEKLMKCSLDSTREILVASSLNTVSGCGAFDLIRKHEDRLHVMEVGRQHRGQISSRVYEPVRIEYQDKAKSCRISAPSIDSYLCVSATSVKSKTAPLRIPKQLHNDWLTTKPSPPMLNISSGGSCRPYMDPRLVRRFALVYLATNEDAPIVLCIKDCPELSDFQLSRYQCGRFIRTLTRWRCETQERREKGSAALSSGSRWTRASGGSEDPRDGFVIPSILFLDKLSMFRALTG
ncbi:hypothetical protein C8R44DRAFT_753926 [Mycena epipterygia]|nr:hypothetical protein C8R44DRAFT_753926 [Mycena epipterygia]